MLNISAERRSFIWSKFSRPCSRTCARNRSCSVANVYWRPAARRSYHDDADDVGHHKHLRRAEHNIGTLSKTPSVDVPRREEANAGHIVLLDPVGAGASACAPARPTGSCRRVRFDAVRGNISEIKTLHRQRQHQRTWTDAVDAVTEQTSMTVCSSSGAFAQKTGCIVAVTGAIDLERRRALLGYIHNGRGDELHITGTGCQLGTDDRSQIPTTKLDTRLPPA